MTKSRPIGVRFSTVQVQAVDSAAKAVGMSRSRFIRSATVGVARALAERGLSEETSRREDRLRVSLAGLDSPTEEEGR